MISDDPESHEQTLNMVLWGSGSYEFWRHIESVKLVATQSCDTRRCKPRVCELIKSVIEKNQLEKIKTEIGFQQNPFTKIGMRFNSLQAILDTLIIFLAHQMNHNVDHTKNMDMRYLKLYITNSYRYIDTGPCTSHHCALSNVKPFVTYAMQQIGRYFLLTTIYNRNTSFQLYQRGIVNHKSPFFDHYYLKKHVEDYHGQTFLHYMNISHRVKKILAIGFLDEELIQQLVPSQEKIAYDKNTNIISMSNHIYQVYSMFAPPKQYMKIAKEPGFVLPDPYNEYHISHKDIDTINKTLSQNDHLASLEVRKIMCDLENLLREKHPKPVGLPTEFLKLKSWKNMYFLGQNPENKSLFLNIENMINYTFNLCPPGVQSRKFMLDILRYIPDTFQPSTTPQEIRERCMDGVMYYVFLKEVSGILSQALKKKNRSGHGEPQCITLEKSMYYLFLISGPSMQLSDNGKKRTSLPKRGFECGRYYQIYVRCYEEFEKMGKANIPDPLDWSKLEVQNLKLGRTLRLEPGEIKPIDNVLKLQVIGHSNHLENIQMEKLGNPVLKSSVDSPSQLGSPTNACTNARDPRSSNHQLSDMQIMNSMNFNQPLQERLPIEPINSVTPSKSLGAQSRMKKDLDLNLCLGMPSHSDKISEVSVSNELSWNDPSLFMNSKMHDQDTDSRENSDFNEDHKRKLIDFFEVSHQSIKNTRIQPQN